KFLASISRNPRFGDAQSGAMLGQPLGVDHLSTNKFQSLINHLEFIQFPDENLLLFKPWGKNRNKF
ncbi:hypothetical protein, partial [Endozoicomonas sp. ONNA2]|uniref:hypothetical protein n=1 Tax=Endozoicomonas sp. ONNA2 TaxID=2828741 RepID=UPI0021497CB1